jgi:hypothetical protein
MEQLVLILIIAAISFVNWLIKKSAEARQRRKFQRQEQLGGEPEIWQEPERNEPPASSEDPDASMRRLMEALGLPVEAEPPPVPAHRTPTAPPAPVVERPIQPPPLPQTVVPRVPEKPAFPVARIASPAGKSVLVEPTAEKRSPGSVHDLLASPDSLKKAIILTEILGASKALKP